MKEEQKRIIRRVMLITLCVLINIAGRYISQKFQLPLWLDTIGTFIAVYYTNIFGGIISAVAVNAAVGISDNVSTVYMLVGIVLTLLMRLFAKKGYMDAFIPAMLSSFCIGLLSAVVSTLVDFGVYDGHIGNMWGDALVDMMNFYGFSGIICTFAGECFLNIVDKQISVLVLYAVIRLNRMRRDRDWRNCRSAAAIMLAVMCFALIFMFHLLADDKEDVVQTSVKTENFVDLSDIPKNINFNDYVKTVYNVRNGLPSSAANAVVQTPDGYIWIGGYAGLSRYDGRKFQYITDGSLSNIMAMIADKSGRLWLATNDQGIAVYENGNVRYITKADGLTSNSVRMLYEAENGVIYAGTAGKLVTIDKNFKVNEVKGAPEGVVSLTFSDGYLVGVDNNGNLFSVKDGRLISCEEYNSDIYSYRCVYAADDGIYAGTSGSLLLFMKVDASGVHTKESIDCSSLNNITKIQQDKAGVIWLLGDNGAGYLDKKDKVKVLNYSGFDSSIECMLHDYEGNYWFASSRFGLMKLCLNIFTNIHESADKEAPVVNAVSGFQGYLYCGTDNGLQIIDPQTYQFINDKLIDFIGDVRVRCLKVDSKGCLWICCYGGPGLVCVHPDGRITSYNEADGTAGDSFRCILELFDGTIAAGSSKGITFIKDGAVTGTLTKKDGLKTPQILSMAQTLDDTLYAGSDGSGIYVIKNGKLEQVLAEESGLSSLTILRLVVYRDICFVITGNSIGVMRKNEVRKISTFPYFNNYDIIVRNDEAWVLSSKGIYIANVQDLLADNFKYKLYDYSNGFMKSITTNSWTYVDKNDILYFCTNEGIEKIAMKRKNMHKGDYKIQISSFMADGRLFNENNGTYTIAADVDRIEITPAICSYLLNDLKICAYIEGLDKNPVIKRQSQLDNLIYTNVPSGKYTLHIQIFNDMEDKMLQEKTYTIIKKAKMWENGYFAVYLSLVLLGEMLFLVWGLNNMRHIVKRRKELEILKAELENQVREQVDEIKEKSQKMEIMQWNVIEGMSSLIESRDGNTGEHVMNTREYVKMLSSELLRRGMYPDIINEKFVATIVRVAPLHDVGKIKISDVILNKPGRFTPEEFELMKQHTVLGGEIVADILGEDADPYMLQMAEVVATYHHEKWDGSGYPEGLAGESIPLAARIMAIADVFDAIISKRVYKEALDIEEGFAELLRCQGKHFDAELVQVFLAIKDKVIKYYREK